MLRYTIARHPRKASLVAATLCAVVVYVVAVAWLVANQWQSIAANQQIAIIQVEKIRNSVMLALERLNQDFPPDCNEANLTALRRLQFHTQQIGDIGVIDRQGRLACTSVVGVLPQSLEMDPPDTVMVTSNGDVRVNFQTTLRAVDSDVKGVVVQTGRFNAVVSPYAMLDLLHAGISAVQLANPKGGIFTAVEDDTLDKQWLNMLRTSAYTSGNLQRFEWSDKAFVAVSRVPQTAYFVQTMVPLNVFFQSHRYLFLVGLGLALLIGLLVFQALEPIFTRWRALEYRIEKLLTDKCLRCVYQPILDLRTQRPIGCEVLMRLQVGHEALAPDLAIPAIIARDLTWRLDQMVVRKAIGELAQHLPDLRDFKVSFNFFPANVTNAKLQKLFAQVLAQTPHAGLRFDVEVLEQEYGDGIIGEIAQLRKNDFLFSVDDFGTGYSNLGSIKAISPDFIKIDRSFVHDMEDASIRSSLIPEIIGIARAVGAQLVAEGIENARQLHLLRAMGVEFGQGYYFAKPQPIAGFVQYLAKVQSASASGHSSGK